MPVAHRILVVEDEPVLAQNVGNYLGRRSPNVCVVSDGKRAMEVIESFAPDVVVLDFGLPGENGLQIYTEMMRQRTHPIGCVMVTGYPLENVIPPAKKLGINYVLSKPFSLSELQQLIDESAKEALRDWQ